MQEFLSVAQAAAEAAARGEPAVLASLVRVRGSSPRHGSARMLVWPDGRIAGTIGGGTLEWRVMEHARQVLAEGRPRYSNYVFDTHGRPDSVGLCGGSVDVHLDLHVAEFARLARAAGEAVEAGERVALATVVREGEAAPARAETRLLAYADGRVLGRVGPEALQAQVTVEARNALADNQSRLATIAGEAAAQPTLVHCDVLRPEPTLLIVGAGHVARPLASMGAQLGLRVQVVDDRPEWASRERFPEPIELGLTTYQPEGEILGPIPFKMTPSTYVIVATWGYDLPAMAQALEQAPALIGLVGSPTKSRLLFQRLLQAGYPRDRVQAIRAPMGLDVGAESPAEIAVSILAEVLSTRRHGSGRPLREVRGARIDSLFTEAKPANAAAPTP
ncbi:MAG: XdhC family protein [Anaerolineales bacterium]|nr:XdhC family protein [Anaerolineales bacterium]